MNVIASLPFGDIHEFGPGLEGVLLQLRSAAFAAKSDTAYLAERTDRSVKLLCSFNLPAAFGLEWQSSSSLKNFFQKKLFIPNLSTENVSKNLKDSPEEKWKFLISVPIRSCISSALLTLTCASRVARPDFNQSDLDTVSAISECLGHYLMLLNDLKTFAVTSNSRVVQACEYQVGPAKEVGLLHDIWSNQPSKTNGDIAHQFLIQTLVRGPKIRTFKGVSCIIINSWRSIIKEWQLKALKICKCNPSEEFVQSIADDFARRLSELGVLGMLDCVTHVPCGHSGPECLSFKIAHAIAKILGVRHEVVFRNLNVSGSSHPRKNVTRPGMEILPHKMARYLLVDDVVTSGSHIVEAATLIRQNGSLAYPIVWIGG